MDSNIILHLRSVEVVQKYGNNGGQGMYHSHGGLGSATQNIIIIIFFLESALFTVISLLYVLTTVTKCQIAGDLPSALSDALEPGWSPG